MGRPIGSKNKKTPIVVPPKKKEITVNTVDKPVDNVPRGTFCKCGHEQENHYGGEKGHCNRMNCECLQFQ